MYKGAYRHEAQLPVSRETEISQVGITVFILQDRWQFSLIFK
jgi:hypothetical protein